jgi:hypothetical protein
VVDDEKWLKKDRKRSRKIFRGRREDERDERVAKVQKYE